MNEIAWYWKLFAHFTGWKLNYQTFREVRFVKREPLGLCSLETNKPHIAGGCMPCGDWKETK